MPVATDTTALFTTSDETGGNPQMNPLVTEYGAHSVCCLPLAPTKHACASSCAVWVCDTHRCALTNVGVVTSDSDVTCGWTVTATGFDVIDAADAVT